MDKIALITGINGQLGHWLVMELNKRGYEIHGFCRKNVEYSHPSGGGKVTIHRVDVMDEHSIQIAFNKIKPTHIFHMAAFSSVAASFDNATTVYETNIGGTLNILNAVMICCPEARVFHPASSECFGDTKVSPQTESTPFNPRNPYGVSKSAAFWTVKMYRQMYGIFATNGIMFNMESSFRNPEFLSKKLSRGIAEIAVGKRGEIALGNLDCYRDIMFAGDAASGIVDSLEHNYPDDFLFSTGKYSSIRELCEVGFRAVNMPIEWGFDSDKGISNHFTEVGRKRGSGRILIRIDPKYYRPGEEHILVGNPAKVRNILGWEAKTDAKDLIQRMVWYELGALMREGHKLDGREAPKFILEDKYVNGQTSCTA